MKRPPRLISILTAGALLLALAPAAKAGPAPAKTYRDPVHKFSLKIFADWEQVPIEAGEETEVCKFVEGGADKGFAFSPKLRVVRVPKGAKAKGPDITGGDMPELPPEIADRFGPPKSAWDATIKNLNTDEKNLPSPDKFKKVESDDKVPGKLWAFDIPFDAWVGQPPEILVTVLGSFEKDDVEYGILLTCSKSQGNKYRKGFEQVVKSFKFFDAKATDVESLDILEGVNITAARRRQIERSKIKGWDVIVSPKKQYIIIYNTKNGKNHQLAKIIAERIEKIREQVYEVQFPPAKPITSVSIVRVCKDPKEYYAYGGPGSSAGYWNSGTEELVFYDASPAKKIDDDTVSVLYHEAFHQFIFYSVGEVAPHSWFNEGHGDYYAGAQYKGGKFLIRPFSWRVGVVKSAIVEGARPFSVEKDDKGEEHVQWGQKGYTPLKALVGFSQGEYYSYPDVSYAQGWSLIYFLREAVPKNKKWNEKWGKILETYFNVLKAGVNPPEPKAEEGAGNGEGKDDGDGGLDLPEPPEDPTQPGDPSLPPDEPGGPEGPGGPGTEPGSGEPVPQGFIPPEFLRYTGGREALEKALKEAFKDVDWEEFEKAWRDCTKGVSG